MANYRGRYFCAEMKQNSRKEKRNMQGKKKAISASGFGPALPAAVASPPRAWR